jgi:hypothetical protein
MRGDSGAVAGAILRGGRDDVGLKATVSRLNRDPRITSVISNVVDELPLLLPQRAERRRAPPAHDALGDIENPLTI